MPVGVPEQAVFDAADRVLARGERPTTERVRAELGRGSPARVGHLLEQWWDALAKRLAGETRLPEMPPAVAGAFRTAWSTAVEHAHVQADAAVAQSAAELEDAQRRLADERRSLIEMVDSAETKAVMASAAKDIADARLLDLQRLLDHQAAQLVEGSQQREQMQSRIAQLQDAMSASESALAALRNEAAQERDAVQAHLRTVEDRANLEIDRARQEAKTAQTELATSRREHVATERSLREQLERSKTALLVAEREATIQRAGADALREQFARLGDLPAAVEARLAQIAPTQKAAQPGAKAKLVRRKRSS